MQAQQCVELTGTNRSFDLIALICQGASGMSARKTKDQFCEWRMANSEWRMAKGKREIFLPHSLFATRHSPASTPSFAGLVALGKAIRPDPIPNSAVKRLSANGTLSQDTGE